MSTPKNTSRIRDDDCERAEQKAKRVAKLIEGIVESEGCMVSVQREGVFLVAHAGESRHSAPLFYEPF